MVQTVLLHGGTKILQIFSLKQGSVSVPFQPECNVLHFKSLLDCSMQLHNMVFTFENLSLASANLIYLKVHSCRYENLAIYSSLHKNRIIQIAHYNTFHFLRYAHFRFARYLFTSIQNQQNTLKTSLLFKKSTKFTGE